MKDHKGKSNPIRRTLSKTPSLTSEDLVAFGAPRELEAQIDFALSSLRVVGGYLGGARYGTCQDERDEEAAGMLIDRTLEFLEQLDLSRVSVKRRTGEEGD